MNIPSNARLTIMILAAALLAAIVPALQLTYAAGPWYVAPGGNDSNTCASAGAPCATINGAIGKASAGDTIYIATGVYAALGDQVVAVYKDAILSGGWNAGFTVQSGTSIIDGQLARRGITVISGTTVTIEHITVVRGHNSQSQSQFLGNGIWNEGYLALTASTVSDSWRGGIYNKGTLTMTNSLISTNGFDGLDNEGALFLNNSTVSGNGRNGIFNVPNSISILNNSAVTGNTFGGIFNRGDLSLVNSTVSGNRTTDRGGGVYVYSGTLTLHSSTISSNTADYGGGVFIEAAGIVTSENSIIAGNSAVSSGADCSGALSSVSYSFIGDTFGCTVAVGTENVLGGGARLLPLTGSPGYHLLLPDSPAIDAGNPAGCTDDSGNPLLFDQRGAPRVGRCDIGAIEFGSIPASLNKQVFLPLVTRNACTVGLCGYVTENGVPAVGVLVELRFVNGPTESTRASVLTTAGGRYSFTNVPSLMPGQSYYVRYLNETVASRLFLWETRSLQTYTTGDVVNMGSFDIANIDLTAPDPDATVSLPRLFQWTPRHATPLDNYEFSLFDPVDGDPSFYTEPPLGYTGGYTLRNLPGGFNTSIPYAWYVGVYDLSGGYGESFYAYYVTFSSASPSLHVESGSKPLGKVNLSGYSIHDRAVGRSRSGANSRNDAIAP